MVITLFFFRHENLLMRHGGALERKFQPEIHQRATMMDINVTVARAEAPGEGEIPGNELRLSPDRQARLQQYLRPGFPPDDHLP